MQEELLEKEAQLSRNLEKRLVIIYCVKQVM